MGRPADPGEPDRPVRLVDEDLTGRENLVLARLLGHSRTGAKQRAQELLEAFGLTDAAARLIKTYSGGMRRWLDLAASIIVTPDLLSLDGPTTGLDPVSRSNVWEIVRAAVAARTTTSHHPVPRRGRRPGCSSSKSRFRTTARAGCF